MACYKLVDRSLRSLRVDLAAQLMPGSFEHALDFLIDTEIDVSGIARRYLNDDTGAPAYDPAVMLKIVLLAYSRGIVSSRSIERLCRENVLFMAISGDSAPQFTTIAKFVRELGDEVGSIFTQVLLICERRGLIGRQMFAIDGVKLPSNADKRHSGTHAELAHEAERMDKAVARMLKARRSREEVKELPQDESGATVRIERLQAEAKRIREFLATHEERRSEKGAIRKSNLTDNDSAKMATSKGVIQGYTAVAVVDSKAQIIVAAQAHGSGSEQSVLLPMVERTAGIRDEHTLITADAGYHSEVNLKGLHELGVPALIADGLMRRRDERFADQAKYKALPDPLYDKAASAKSSPVKFKPADFTYDPETNICVCPAGKTLYSTGSHCTTQGRVHPNSRAQSATACPARFATSVCAIRSAPPHGRSRSSPRIRARRWNSPNA
jgi:transposase